MTENPFETGLDRNAANHVPLTPLSFLERTAAVFPTRTSVIHGARRWTWAETAQRCRDLASALANHGIGAGDTVSVMLPNVPPAFEATFGVPMTGGDSQRTQHPARRRDHRLHPGTRRCPGS